MVKEVKNWDVDEVAIWLHSIGLGEKIDPFRENAVEGDTLVGLTHGELTEDLGLSNLQAKKVLRLRDAAIDAGSSGDAAAEKDAEIAELKSKLAATEAKLESAEAKLKALQAPVAPPAQAAPPKPAPAPTPAPAPAPPKGRPVVRGAATGAAGGALKGAIAGAILPGMDASDGAKAGAAVGATRGGLRGIRARRHGRR